MADPMLDVIGRNDDLIEQLSRAAAVPMREVEGELEQELPRNNCNKKEIVDLLYKPTRAEGQPIVTGSTNGAVISDNLENPNQILHVGKLNLAEPDFFQCNYVAV